MMARDGVQIISPKDRAGWLKARRGDVTASAIGALFNGAHDFVTPYSLWAEKSGRASGPDQETPAMRRGRLLEAAAVQMLREDHPEWVIDHNAADNRYFRDPVARIGATPDVLADAPGRGLGVIQIKSVEPSVFRKKWIEEPGAEPEPPFWIALQAVTEAWLVGARWAAVGALVVGHGIDLHLVEVPLDDMAGVMAEASRRVADFWFMVEAGQEPQPDYERDAGLIDSLYAIGDPREEVDLTDDYDVENAVLAATECRHELQSWTNRLTALEAKIKARMGAAEIAHIAGGKKITWRTIRKANPGGLPTTYRVLRLPA